MTKTPCRAGLIRSFGDQSERDRREHTLSVLAEAAKEGPGQPPRVDHLRTALKVVEQLESEGIPFGTCENSRMNKEVRRALNEEAERSTDDRKSRRKKITAGAVKVILKQVKFLCIISSNSWNNPPYNLPPNL